MIFPIVILLVNLAYCLSCNPRYFGQSSFVCVCDEKQCDSLDQDHRFIPGNQVYIYRSDIAEFRLHKTEHEARDLLPDATNQPDVSVKIDREDRRQSLNGFGGAFTDATGINILKLPIDLRARVMEDYFSPNGLEYTLGRVPMGSSDFSDRVYSYDDFDGDYELENFSLAADDFDYKIPFMRQALSLSPELKFFAAPWSAPAWLKTEKRITGMSMLIDVPGSKAGKTWANYFVKFLQAYESNGIDFWGLSPQNEPMSGFKPSVYWNSMGYTDTMMAAFVKIDLGPALEAAGYGKDRVKLIINDGFTDYLEVYVRGVMEDSQAARYISGVGYHWYHTHYYENLEKVHQQYPELFLLSTEACEGWHFNDHGVSLGNWTRAETYAEDIIEGLNRWSTGWVDWNMALNLRGGPNWAGNFVDSPIVVNETGGEYYRQPMFYALGHFSKFLPPGSVRVGHTVDRSNDAVKLTSFVNTRDQLVLIVLNTENRSMDINLDGFHSNPIQVTLTPKSITTILTNNL